MPLSKGELGRLALMDYLFQRADRGKRGEELLVPERQSFQQYLEARLSARLDAVYDVGSLLELLPRYLDYRKPWELCPACLSAASPHLLSYSASGVEVD